MILGSSLKSEKVRDVMGKLFNIALEVLDSLGRLGKHGYERDPDYKMKIKAIFIYKWHDCLCRKFCEIYKNVTKTKKWV